MKAKAAPKAIGLGHGAWNNAKSLTDKAMTWAGLTTIPGHYQAPYAPEWAVLWSQLPPNSALSYQLARLFHFCSANGVRPEEMCDEVLERFHQALEEESLVENPYEIYRGAAKSWNNALVRISGWPGQHVSVPSKRSPPFTLQWTALPEALRFQVDAHLASLAGIDLDGDVTRPMRPATSGASSCCGLPAPWSTAVFRRPRWTG